MTADEPPKQLDLQQRQAHFNWNEVLPGEVRLWVQDGKMCFTLAEWRVLAGYVDDVLHWMEIYADIREEGA